MTITTLRTGALTLTAVQYKFDASGLLTIKLTTDGNHKLYGDVNIALTNVKNINVYNAARVLAADYFNNTFLFSRTSPTTLEFSVNITSGITQSDAFITLPNNGDDIIATVNNTSIDLTTGTYNFALLDTTDSEFSTSHIGVKQLNVGGTGVDGVESLFYEVDDFTATPKEFTINGQDLTFYFNAKVSLKADDANVTNIPLVITKIS